MGTCSHGLRVKPTCTTWRRFSATAQGCAAGVRGARNTNYDYDYDDDDDDVDNDGDDDDDYYY